jgi:hypothetical protein
MTGASGTLQSAAGVVPTGYTLSNSCGSGVTVAAVETTLGGAAAVNITISGVSTVLCLVSFSDNGRSLTTSSGDLYEAFSMFSAGPNPTGVNAFGVFYDGGKIFESAMNTGNDPLWGTNSFRGVLRTVPFPASAGTSSERQEMRIMVQAGVPIHFSMTLARWGYRRQQ